LFSPAWRDETSFMGKRRRDALGKRRLEGAPTDKNGI
jgi:hypothetical protein